jgi:hypothetical protein
MPQLVKAENGFSAGLFWGRDWKCAYPQRLTWNMVFRAGSALFLRGSRSSGVFIMGNRERLDGSILKPRVLAEGGWVKTCW